MHTRIHVYKFKKKNIKTDDQQKINIIMKIMSTLQSTMVVNLLLQVTSTTILITLVLVSLSMNSIIN